MTGSLRALIRIETRYFVAGIEVDDQGTVIEAAPILKWTIGKKLAKVKKWKQITDIQCVSTWRT